jgi:hypothetical protein
MIGRLALISVVASVRIAGATKACPGPEPVITTLDGSSAWRTLPEIPGRVHAAATNGDTVFVTAAIDQRATLLRLVGDRWEPVPDAPPVGTIVVLGDYIYALGAHNSRAELSYARLDTMTWTSNPVPPEARTLFRCGPHLCASTTFGSTLAAFVADGPVPSGALAWTPVESAQRLASVPHMSSGDPFVWVSAFEPSIPRVFDLSPDATYAVDVTPGTRFDAWWHHAGPPLPIRNAGAVWHGNWIIAAGGSMMQKGRAERWDGPCGPRPLQVFPHHTYAARIVSDHMISAWHTAAPLPHGGFSVLAAGEQRLYAFAPTDRSTTVVAMPWSELEASVAPDPDALRPRVVHVPTPPWTIDIPDGWTQTDAEPLDAGASIAYDYAVPGDPGTILHVEWIEEHLDRDADRTLSDRMQLTYDVLLGYPHGYNSIAPLPPSGEVTAATDQPPNARMLHMVGDIDGGTVRITAAVCAGRQGRLSACEDALATLQPFAPPSRWRPLAWMLGLAAIVLAGLILSWRVRRGAASHT